jgi:hypothetical protein
MVFILTLGISRILACSWAIGYFYQVTTLRGTVVGSNFDEAKGNYSDLFRLTPIDADIFQLAMEDWSSWQRWELAFKTGKTGIRMHPALPDETNRHLELKRILDRPLE